MSASTLSRSGLDELRDDASKGIFDALLVYDLDRLCRDVGHLAVLRREFDALGVKILLSKHPHQEGPQGNLLMNVLGSFSEYERALILDRTRRGRRYKTETLGLVLGNIPPYGYRYVKRNREEGVMGGYQVDAAEAAVVRRIYSWVVQDGASGREVVRRLNRDGIHSRSGRPWAKSSVLRVLSNETYCGTTHYNKHETSFKPGCSSQRRICRQRPKEEWVPIQLPSELRLVTRRVFDAARERIQGNRSHPLGSRKHRYLLKRVERRCAHCGNVYGGDSAHGRRYYRCAGSRDTPRCAAGSVNADAAEALVWEFVEQSALDPARLAERINSYHKRSRPAAPPGATPRPSAEKELSQIDGERQRLVAAYQRGHVSMRELESTGELLKARHATASGRLHAADPEPRPTPSKVEVQHDVKHWATYVASQLARVSDDSREKIVALLVRGVVFDAVERRLLLRVYLPTGAGPATGSPRGRNSAVRSQLDRGVVSTTVWRHGRDPDEHHALEFWATL